METTASLFDKIHWRLGRWLTTAGALLVFGLRSPEIWQLRPIFWLLVLAGLLAPELALLWPQARPEIVIISVISDAALIALLSLGLNQTLVLLYSPLIVASSSITAWRGIPLLLSLLAVGVTMAIVFSTAKNAQSLSLIAMYSLIFILTGAVADLLRRYLAQETATRTVLEKKFKTRSDYFLMRAHEIRTPLTLIRTSVELILDGAPGPLTDQQRVFLENVDENSQHISLLAENMLTKSKLESGVFQPTFQPTDIRDPIRAVVADMHTFSIRRKQDIRVYYPQILPPVSADPVLLRQALTNLIRNAIQHTSSGGQIIVSIAKNDLNLLVSVTDDGAGMSVEQRKQIFRRFATGRGGTGLGLMIIKQIVELHGGQVYIDTSLGRGTTFMLTFPFLAQTAEGQE